MCAAHSKGVVKRRSVVLLRLCCWLLHYRLLRRMLLLSITVMQTCILSRLLLL